MKIAITYITAVSALQGRTETRKANGSAKKVQTGNKHSQSHSQSLLKAKAKATARHFRIVSSLRRMPDDERQKEVKSMLQKSMLQQATIDPNSVDKTILTAALQILADAGKTGSQKVLADLLRPVLILLYTTKDQENNNAGKLLEACDKLREALYKEIEMDCIMDGFGGIDLTQQDQLEVVGKLEQKW